MSATTATASTPPSKANDHQIGGQHYKTGSVEHWDVIQDADVPYLLGCASKYIARHHLKDGREALLKAIHYQEKWLEKVGPSTSRREARVSIFDLMVWTAAAELRAPEVQALIMMLTYGKIVDSLQLTRALLELRYPEPNSMTDIEWTKHILERETNRALNEKLLMEKTKSAGIRGAIKQAEKDHLSMFPLGSGTAVNALYQNVPGTPEDGGHHAQQPQEVVDEEADSEVIQRYTWEEYSRCPTALPMELTIHVWQHRCDDWAKKKYSWDNSAARYIRDKMPA